MNHGKEGSEEKQGLCLVHPHGDSKGSDGLMLTTLLQYSRRKETGCKNHTQSSKLEKILLPILIET